MSLLDAIAELIDSLPNERLPLSAELVEVAKRLKFLPAALDWGGGFGIRPNGDVVSYTWDNLAESVNTEDDSRIRNIVYFSAAQVFPRLRRHVPQRPRGAPTCPHCDGSGMPSGLPEELRKGNSIVCYCGGLGWLPLDVSLGLDGKENA